MSPDRPLCLCSAYKLALNSRIVSTLAHNVGRVNKSMCCSPKVSSVDSIVPQLVTYMITMMHYICTSDGVIVSVTS